MTDQITLGGDASVSDESGGTRAEAEAFAAEDSRGPSALSAAGLGAPSLSAALEALLIVAEEPMTVEDLAVATASQPTLVQETLVLLQQQYLADERGFEIRQISGGWRFLSAAACSGLMHRWVTDGRNAKLSQAALETLAVIAYRQPVSRARISAIRGVSVDAVVRTLQARGLIEEAGIEPTSGAHLYRTTRAFLERLGLTDLAELPPIAHLLPAPEDVTDHVEGTELS